jgi:diaminopimelate epimerase
MCGNGIRCVARLFARRDAGFSAFGVETKGGVLRCETLPDGGVRVGMGAPRFGAAAAGLARADAARVTGEPPVLELLGRRGVLVSVGNPHFVVFLTEAPGESLVRAEGPAIERHASFPDGVNAQFAFVESPRRVTLRTWERGAGMTSACGTGACAAFASGHALGLLDDAATVSLPGGELRFERAPDGGIAMTGPATIVFEGEWLGD